MGEPRPAQARPRGRNVTGSSRAHETVTQKRGPGTLLCTPQTRHAFTNVLLSEWRRSLWKSPGRPDDLLRTPNVCTNENEVSSFRSLKDHGASCHALSLGSKGAHRCLQVPHAPCSRGPAGTLPVASLWPEVPQQVLRWQGRRTRDPTLLFCSQCRQRTDTEFPNPGSDQDPPPLPEPHSCPSSAGQNPVPRGPRSSSEGSWVSTWGNLTDRAWVPALLSTSPQSLPLFLQPRRGQLVGVQVTNSVTSAFPQTLFSHPAPVQQILYIESC